MSCSHEDGNRNNSQNLVALIYSDHGQSQNNIFKNLSCHRQEGLNLITRKVC
jgi:hypothetical protein